MKWKLEKNIALRNMVKAQEEWARSDDPRAQEHIEALEELIKKERALQDKRPTK